MARPRKPDKRQIVSVRLAPTTIAALDSFAADSTRTAVIERAILALDLGGLTPDEIHAEVIQRAGKIKTAIRKTETQRVIQKQPNETPEVQAELAAHLALIRSTCPHKNLSKVGAGYAKRCDDCGTLNP